jgi:hypothetical protein
MRSSILSSAIVASLLVSSTSFAQQVAGVTDHAGVVGRYGATWFSPVSLAVLNGAAQNANELVGQLAVTPVGVRYWMASGWGIDAGVGLGFQSGSRESKSGNTTTTVDAPSAFGLVLHGGAPFALSTGKHYSFLAIPEVNLGFSSSSVKSGENDLTVSGFHLDLGARAGAEIQFGFIDIPQLSLQATVGAALAFDRLSTKNGANEGSQSQTNFGTSVQNEPWSIFRSNVAAIYYF